VSEILVQLARLASFPEISEPSPKVPNGMLSDATESYIKMRENLGLDASVSLKHDAGVAPLLRDEAFFAFKICLHHQSVLPFLRDAPLERKILNSPCDVCVDS